MYKNGRKMTVHASRLPPPRFSNALSAHIFETAINYETDNQEWLDYINILVLKPLLEHNGSEYSSSFSRWL